MSLQMQVCCDVCGRMKREINHWWVLLPGRVTGIGDQTKWLRISAMPWNDEDAASPMAQHICGQACMLKAIERFMQCHEVVRDPVLASGPRKVPYPDEPESGEYDYSPLYQN